MGATWNRGHGTRRLHARGTRSPGVDSPFPRRWRSRHGGDRTRPSGGAHPPTRRCRERRPLVRRVHRAGTSAGAPGVAGRDSWLSRWIAGRTRAAGRCDRRLSDEPVRVHGRRSVARGPSIRRSGHGAARCGWIPRCTSAAGGGAARSDRCRTRRGTRTRAPRTCLGRTGFARDRDCACSLRSRDHHLPRESDATRRVQSLCPLG